MKMERRTFLKAAAAVGFGLSAYDAIQSAEASGRSERLDPNFFWLNGHDVFTNPLGFAAYQDSCIQSAETNIQFDETRGLLVEAHDDNQRFTSQFTLESALLSLKDHNKIPWIDGKDTLYTTAHAQYLLDQIGRAQIDFTSLPFSSRQWQVVDYLKRQHPEMYGLYTVNEDALFSTERFFAEVNFRPRLGRSALAIKHTLITPDLVHLAHSYGFFVHGWTVDTIAKAQELTNMGVDGLTSNFGSVLTAASRAA